MIKSVDTPNGKILYDLKTTKSRKIIVKIAKDGRIICSCPQKTDIAAVEDFLKRKSKWIINNSNKFKEDYEKLQNSELEEIFVFGKSYPIVIVPSNNVDIFFENGKIFLYGDKEKSLKELKTKLFKFAEEYLTARTEQIKKQIGENSNFSVEIKNVKSWWGCYSVKNKKVKLSFRLIAREKSTIDGVIYHELAHIKVQNHQREFYAVLLSYCPDYFSRKKSLNNGKYAACDKFVFDK